MTDTFLSNIDLRNYLNLCEIHCTFKELCEKGKLNEAIIFYNINLNKDILYYDKSVCDYFYESVFRITCKHGHLDICKWLLQIKPNINISANEEEAFCLACNNNHIDVCNWFQSIKPYLYVFNYNKDGIYNYYIRNKEEERWQRRKYLVWLASDISPNKNNFFYMIPQDISRLIITFV